VRWDGGHKRDAWLVERLGPFVEWVPVCPEAEIGLGVPREPIHLVRAGRAIRLVGTRSGIDHSGAMRRFAAGRVRALERLALCGYVLKAGSPSCGLARVPIDGARGKTGAGLFASALAAALPSLPIEEEARLADPRLRDHWIERVFAYRRLRSFFATRWSVAGLTRFHAAHELQLLAHAPAGSAELGRLVAGARAVPRRALRARYERLFLETLRRPATQRGHANVLRRALGVLRDRLDAADRRELASVLDGYGRGRIPLDVPVALVRRHAARLSIGALAGQVYLEPDPMERRLRNRV
jgi:uncharacterized protein YbgA (DUF1722 family)/uncharacterized protein YbbK (DUF523 family)